VYDDIIPTHTKGETHNRWFLVICSDDIRMTPATTLPLLTADIGSLLFATFFYRTLIGCFQFFCLFSNF